MLCAVGDLIEDIVAHVDGPIRPSADTAARISRHRGGSAANVAAAAARLDGRSRFVGSVGDDDPGVRLLGGLRDLGVDVRAVQRGRTGTIVALVGEDGDRTFVTDRGASSSLFLEMPGPLLDDVTVLHLPGYGLAAEPLATSIRMLAAVARSRAIPVSVDPSSLSIGHDLGVEAYRQELAGLAPDVLLPNRAEAEQLDLIDRSLAPLTVVTDGAEPTSILDGDGRIEVTVDTPDAAVDTTGAGDAFAAAFLLAWRGGYSPVDATRAGHTAAANVITGPGADWWHPPPRTGENPAR